MKAIFRQFPGINMSIVFSLVTAVLLALSNISYAGNGLDIPAIERAAATTATMKDDGVVRIGWSRNDVPVVVDGEELPPAAGLGSWAAFKSLPGGGVMVMGDTVVFEDEITPAMDAAFAHGLIVTALHNHFTRDRPPVYFMHIGGRADDAESLARGVRAMWDAIKQVRARNAVPSEVFPGRPVKSRGEFKVDGLEEILGAEARDKGEVIKFVFPRRAARSGVEITNTMGVATWAAFTGSQDYASVDGDFAMTSREVQPVMHALRDAGIHIVALHNHMLEEKPAYYFLHYWGKGPAAELARGIRRALDLQKEIN